MRIITIFMPKASVKSMAAPDFDAILNCCVLLRNVRVSSISNSHTHTQARRQRRRTPRIPCTHATRASGRIVIARTCVLVTLHPSPRRPVWEQGRSPGLPVLIYFFTCMHAHAQVSAAWSCMCRVCMPVCVHASTPAEWPSESRKRARACRVLQALPHTSLNKSTMPGSSMSYVVTHFCSETGRGTGRQAMRGGKRELARAMPARPAARTTRRRAPRGRAESEQWPWATSDVSGVSDIRFSRAGNGWYLRSNSSASIAAVFSGTMCVSARDGAKAPAPGVEGASTSRSAPLLQSTLADL